ncbi:MAG: hypothetical protein ACI9K1_002778, partial [Arcticibacterium sp.]
SSEKEPSKSVAMASAKELSAAASSRTLAKGRGSDFSSKTFPETEKGFCAHVLSVIIRVVIVSNSFFIFCATSTFNLGDVCVSNSCNSFRKTHQSFHELVCLSLNSCPKIMGIMYNKVTVNTQVVI